VDEVVAVIEVVVQLAAAGARACPDVVQLIPAAPSLAMSSAGGLEDPLRVARPFAVGRGTCAFPHDAEYIQFDLNSPSRKLCWTRAVQCAVSDDQSNERKAMNATKQDARPSGPEIRQQVFGAPTGKP